MIKVLDSNFALTNTDWKSFYPPSNETIFIWNYFEQCIERNIPLHESINSFMGEPQPEWKLCLLTSYELAHAYMLIGLHKRMNKCIFEGGYDA